MGRHRKKWVEEPDDRVWPFQCIIDLAYHKSKIAFMSGCIREYFPEDPGYSKFGTTYCLPDSEDTAKCTFVPSTNRLEKPISNVGYGIGGLLAQRFPVKKSASVTPAPNAYPTLLPQIRKMKEKGKQVKKSKRSKWQDFVTSYEKIVQEQCAFYEKTGVLSLPPTAHETHNKDPSKLKSKRSKSKHRKDDMKAKPKPPPGSNHPAAAALDSHVCHKNISAFGMGLKSSRFSLDKDNKNTIGPGIYDTKLPVKESFQITTPRGELIPRVRTVCSPDKYDSCMNCGINLINSDYYQTKNKLKVLTKDKQDQKYKITYLSLCRRCYCEGLNDRLQQFEKWKLPIVFMKARHCNAVHDHQEGLTEYLSKATCKVMLNMARKELLYNTYFKDDPCQSTKKRHDKSI